MELPSTGQRSHDRSPAAPPPTGGVAFHGRIGSRSGGRPAGRAIPALVLIALVGLVGGCLAPGAGSSGAASGATASGAGSAPAGGPAGSAVAASPGTPAAPGAAVPPGLVGRTWTVPGAGGGWVAGMLGRESRLDIPAGELPVRAADGRVATVTFRSDQTGSTVRVREITTGRVLAELARSENIGAAVFAADRLLVAGHDPVRTGVDPGVAAISLADGTVSQVIEPGSLPDGWTGSAARALVGSPSGRTVVSSLCAGGRCALDVIDPASGTVRRLIDEPAGFPVALSDEVVIVVADDQSGLEAYELATGQRLWQRTGAEFQYGYVTSDGRYVLSYLDHREPWRFVVSVIDPRTNDERVVLARDPAEGLVLWPELSGDEQAVLGTGGRFEDVSQGAPVVRADLLDLASGALAQGGLTVVVGR
ncbi:MAG: PQQ-binding-like beta-propeller repeat protein [Chloroflexota bacterium]